MRFEEYVSQQGQSLLRFAYVLTGDPHQAEDLTQTTLMTTYRHWIRATAARNRDAYVRRIMINAHLSSLRRRSSTELPTDQLPDGHLADVADPADQVAGADHTRHLLAGLAPRSRTVLVLRYYADLDDDAIAKAMKISPSAVRATASRALATLRAGEALADVAEEKR